MRPHSTMEISQFKALARPLKVVLDDGDGNPLGEIVFRYRPTALTKETLPTFIALDDEPMARAQRELLQAHLEARAQGDVTGEDGELLTMEQLEARIEKRRADELLPHLVRLELAARKLCLLLDPDTGHDLTQEGERLPMAWEILAEHLPLGMIEAVTLSILEKVRDPFDLLKSVQGSIGVPVTAPASGDD